MMTERHPLDGRPYYCAMCGCGFAEFIACEMPDCVIETVEAAKKRQTRAARNSKLRDFRHNAKAQRKRR